MKSEFETLEQYQDSMKKFNENTRMGFEEFIQSHGSGRNKLQLRCTPYTSKKGGYGSFDLDFGLCVYQHQQSKVDELQKRVDLLEGKIKEALNTVYAMKGKADCDHLTDKEQSFVYGFGYELHEILKEEQALKAGCDEAK